MKLVLALTFLVTAVAFAQSDDPQLIMINNELRLLKSNLQEIKDTQFTESLSDLPPLTENATPAERAAYISNVKAKTALLEAKLKAKDPAAYREFKKQQIIAAEEAQGIYRTSPLDHDGSTARFWAQKEKEKDRAAAEKQRADAEAARKADKQEFQQSVDDLKAKASEVAQGATEVATDTGKKAANFIGDLWNKGKAAVEEAAQPTPSPAP